jgi:uncharacterized membrane protein
MMNGISNESLRTTAITVYVLYFLSIFFGVTAIIGVIIAHVKGSDTLLQ